MLTEEVREREREREKERERQRQRTCGEEYELCAWRTCWYTTCVPECEKKKKKKKKKRRRRREKPRTCVRRRDFFGWEWVKGRRRRRT